MSKTHKSKSRYGEERIFTVEKDHVLLEGSSNFSRFAVSEDTGDLQMVDLEGGPFMTIGMELNLIGCPIKGRITKLNILDSDKEYFVKVKIGFSEN
jgi:hypothetical protein